LPAVSAPSAGVQRELDSYSPAQADSQEDRLAAFRPHAEAVPELDAPHWASAGDSPPEKVHDFRWVLGEVPAVPREFQRAQGESPAQLRDSRLQVRGFAAEHCARCSEAFPDDPEQPAYTGTRSGALPEPEAALPARLPL
jgi:hypothetical protein